MRVLNSKCGVESAKIRARRKELGYSQEYIALKLEISQKAYSDIENGKTKLKSDVLNTIASILEVSPFELCPISCDCTSELQLKHEQLLDYLYKNNINFPEDLA